MQPTRLLLAFALAGLACAAPAKDTAAKTAAPAQPLIPEDPVERRTTVGTGYALVTAMMVNNDARSIVALYVPDATLILPDTTVHNAPAIATRWVNLAQGKSMADFQRSSLAMSILDDSTLADSGSYVMVSRRSPTDSVMAPGVYRTRWRARPGIGNWVILEDQIIPGPGKKSGTR
jgi:hypothetical protein